MTEQSSQELQLPRLWHPNTSRKENLYVAFKALLTLEKDQQIGIQIHGADLYRFYLDGNQILEGPVRYEATNPEYDQVTILLVKGVYPLVGLVHHHGVENRMSPYQIPPFFQCGISTESGPIDLDWKCQELHCYGHLGRRTSPLLGWSEFCDTRLLPDLHTPWFDDQFIQPISVHVNLGPLKAKTQKDCMSLETNCLTLGRGTYTNHFGYENDDPPVRFLLRNLEPEAPSEGLWVRYDFGKIGLYQPRVVLKAPAGTVVEAGYSSELLNNRVTPVLSLSGGPTSFLDRWITQGTNQELTPFSPRGFRFVELHIQAPEELVEIESVQAIQRSYFPLPTQDFICSDPLLNRIWMMGAQTLQSCSEDALVDTPVRERGQWYADAMHSGAETLAVSYGDLSLVRRSLVQAAACQREDGLIPGHYPSHQVFISSVGPFWIMGCMRYYQLTGDYSLLTELYDPAIRVMEYYTRQKTPKGYGPYGEWAFLDWGLKVDQDHINIPLNLLIFGALKDLLTWSTLLNKQEDSLGRQAQIEELEGIIRSWYFNGGSELPEKSIEKDISSPTSLTIENSTRPSYHATVLGLWFNLFPEEQKSKALGFVKDHILDCFPNNSQAPRLMNPDFYHDQLITPYFMHFSLKVLLDGGETQFVHDQYRKCWGWMLDQGVTTLYEVFDSRWTHCHAWAGCPTWQLSQYCLGLVPDNSGNPLSFEFKFQPGNLEFAEGRIPLANSNEQVTIGWKNTDIGWEYYLSTDQTIHITFAKGNRRGIVVDGKALQKLEGEIMVHKSMEFVQDH